MMSEPLILARDAAGSGEGLEQREGNRMSVLDDLATALGLLQSPGKDAAKDWARQTREAMTNGSTPDQAAMIAATKVFGAAEFQAVKYRSGSVEKLLKGIDAL
jgi:hypothetical protein